MKLFLLLSAFAFSAEKPPAFPETCKQGCVSLFGEKLGATSDGIESFSNCKPACVYANPVFVNKAFSGIEWQCVEFARRWLMKEKGLTFESIDVAADLWNKIEHLVGVKDKRIHPIAKHPNGANALPTVGSLLVYAREYEDTGHVAVVLRVDRKKKLIYVGEQNFENKPWNGDYARVIPYVSHGGGFWLLNAYLLGWLSY